MGAPTEHSGQHSLLTVLMCGLLNSQLFLGEETRRVKGILPLES